MESHSRALLLASPFLLETLEHPGQFPWTTETGSASTTDRAGLTALGTLLRCSEGDGVGVPGVSVEKHGFL